MDLTPEEMENVDAAIDLWNRDLREDLCIDKQKVLGYINKHQELLSALRKLHTKAITINDIVIPPDSDGYDGREESSEEWLQVFATNADMAGAVAIDSIIEEAGLVDRGDEDRDEQMDALRPEYKIIVIYPGHLQNLVK